MARVHKMQEIPSVADKQSFTQEGSLAYNYLTEHPLINVGSIIDLPCKVQTLNNTRIYSISTILLTFCGSLSADSNNLAKKG
jgi:hypothetical protein